MTTEDKKRKSDITAEQAKVSRRSFIKGTAIAGAGAAAILQSENSEAQDSNAAKIRIPDEIPKTLAEAAKPANFPMTGAEVFAKFCNDEGVAGFFCCPGNYNMINAIAAEGIPSYGGRCEGNMVSAADGFIRVTGEIAATSGTEGPGFTNMIMNIGAANAARSPLLVIASNKTIGEDEVWEQATDALKRAAELVDLDLVLDEGGGAFYGPKIDYKIKDALGR